MPQGYNPSFRVMPLGHKLGRKTIMTRLMPLGHNPSTRLMPLRHKVSVYGSLVNKKCTNPKGIIYIFAIWVKILSWCKRGSPEHVVESVWMLSIQSRFYSFHNKYFSLYNMKWFERPSSHANKTWFCQKWYALYLTLCKSRNILGAASGKHHIERDHVPHSAKKLES